MSTFEFPAGAGLEETLVVTAQWHPDPEIMEAQIAKIANSFDDWSVPMQKIRQVMIASTRRRFLNENDPTGAPWKELSDDYWHRKVELGGYPDEILVRTDHMRENVTSEKAWIVTERELFFNVEALPINIRDSYPYGAAHQSGADTGKGAKLPQRMFIGPDNEALVEMEAIFLQHIDRIFEHYWDDPPAEEPGTGGPIIPVAGTTVVTTTGLTGILGTGPSMGGPGFRSVHGPGGRFIGHFFIGH